MNMYFSTLSSLYSCHQPVPSFSQFGLLFLVLQGLLKAAMIAKLYLILLLFPLAILATTDVRMLWFTPDLLPPKDLVHESARKIHDSVIHPHH
jgi:hypothetical protein